MNFNSINVGVKNIYTYICKKIEYITSKWSICGLHTNEQTNRTYNLQTNNFLNLSICLG
jgi:hypothetical protein